MSQKTINIGTQPDDGRGDKLRIAFDKANQNFTELYGATLGTGGGGTVTQVNTGTGLTGGPITTTGTVALANTSVLPGPYSSANIMVDAQGRITAASDGSGGGSVAGIGSPVFGSVAEATAAVIPSNVNTIQVLGYNIPGDAGGGAYARISSLPSFYAGDGQLGNTPPYSPSFPSGGLPVLCFATTWFNHQTNAYGPTSQAIQAGCLTFIFMVTTIASPPPSFTDSVGNTYLLAAHEVWTSFGSAIYYCSSPVLAPAGTTFNASGVDLSNQTAIYVYCVPGFTGAVLDQTAHASNVGGSTGGLTLTTGTLAAGPQLVIGAVYANQNPVLDASTTFAYTPPAGWSDISPPIAGRNPISCIAVNSTAPVTYNPTWTGTVSTQSLLVTFKVFPRTALNPSFWQLVPTRPVHTAQYGIVASPNVDSYLPFQYFSKWWASIAPPSSTSYGFAPNSQPATTVVISIANPAVITVAPPGIGHGLRNGTAISFSTTGALPSGIVAGRIYYVQYGTVTPTSFQISATGIFENPAQGVTSPKGVPIITSGSQSGTHSYTSYGESWNDFVLDPGIYYSTLNQAPGPCFGVKRWRLFGYGARFQTNAYFTGIPWKDVNSSTGISQQTFHAPFQTTGQQSDHVFLVTPALASQFYVNSWVLLMACETFATAPGNWSPAIFEFLKVASVNASTGKITFYSNLQYNYRSTYPTFAARPGQWSGGAIGPATIVQLSETFDQEIEIHGATFTGVTEENTGGVLSLRMVDCEVFGWGFKTGPFPSSMRNFTMERCRVHNAVSEVDKLIDRLQYIDCEFDSSSPLLIQSATINKFVIDRCKMLAGIGGTPRDLTIRDSFITGTFTVGPVYGTTERLTLMNTHMGTVVTETQEGETCPLSSVTFSLGTIKVLVGASTPTGTWNGPSAESNNPLPWAMPGAKVAIYANNIVTSGIAAGNGPRCEGTMSGALATFVVLDVYTDGSGNFCVDTTLPALPSTTITVTATVSGTAMTVTAISPAGACLLMNMKITGGSLPAGTIIAQDIGIPNAAGNLGVYTLNNSATIGSPTTFTASVPMNFLPHSCPRLTVLNCTGGNFVTDMAGAPPDIPIYSYFKRAYAGFYPNPAYVDTPKVHLCGNLTSWTIDVRRPYTGAAGTYQLTLTLFGWVTSGGNTYPTYINQIINLKTAGIRTITATTTGGGVAGDTLVAVPFWLTGSHLVVVSPVGSDTLEKQPYFIMTGQSDQGVDYGSMTVNTVTSGMDALADTVTGWYNV